MVVTHFIHIPYINFLLLWIVIDYVMEKYINKDIQC